MFNERLRSHGPAGVDDFVPELGEFDPLIMILYVSQSSKLDKCKQI